MRKGYFKGLGACRLNSRVLFLRRPSPQRIPMYRKFFFRDKPEIITVNFLNIVINRFSGILARKHQRSGFTVPASISSLKQAINAPPSELHESSVGFISNALICPTIATFR